MRCELPDARCGVGAPVLRGRSRAAAARAEAEAARAAAARAAAARAAASARAATQRCTPSRACGGALFGFAAEPPGGSTRSRGGGAEVLSAAMSRRARPGGEAGGPRNSQLGCRRRARRRTALLEMGVPPIEQHGGGGWRVGKRKIRFVVGLSKIRKVARCVCAGGGGVGGGGTTGIQRIPPPRKNPRESSRRIHGNPAGESRCSLRRREESKEESNRKIHLQKPCILH